VFTVCMYSMDGCMSVTNRPASLVSRPSLPPPAHGLQNPIPVEVGYGTYEAKRGSLITFAWDGLGWRLGNGTIQ